MMMQVKKGGCVALPRPSTPPQVPIEEINLTPPNTLVLPHRYRRDKPAPSKYSSTVMHLSSTNYARVLRFSAKFYVHGGVY